MIEPMIKSCFIVMVLGYWGRGKTVKEAAMKCRKSGGSNGNRAIVRCIINDDEPTVNGMGEICRAPGSQNIDCGNGYKLGQLLKLD